MANKHRCVSRALGSPGGFAPVCSLLAAFLSKVVVGQCVVQCAVYLHAAVNTHIEECLLGINPHNHEWLLGRDGCRRQWRAQLLVQLLSGVHHMRQV